MSILHIIGGDLINDFFFDRKNLYDGADEYLVITKEKGSREVEESHEERRSKSKKIEALFSAILSS